MELEIERYQKVAAKKRVTHLRRRIPKSWREAYAIITPNVFRLLLWELQVQSSISDDRVLYLKTDHKEISTIRVFVDAEIDHMYFESFDNHTPQMKRTIYYSDQLLRQFKESPAFHKDTFTYKGKVTITGFVEQCQTLASLVIIPEQLPHTQYKQSYVNSFLMNQIICQKTLYIPGEDDSIIGFHLITSNNDNEVRLCTPSTHLIHQSTVFVDKPPQTLPLTERQKELVSLIQQPHSFRPTSLLLHGPPGVGKLSLLRHLQLAHLHVLSPSDIYGTLYQHHSSERKQLKSYLTALVHQIQQIANEASSYIILDEFDILFPKESMDKDADLIEEFLKLLDELQLYNGLQKHHIMLIGITSHLDRMDHHLRTKFENEFLLDMPRNFTKEKETLVNQLLQSNALRPSPIDIDPNALLESTQGFVTSDLLAVLKDAYQKTPIGRTPPFETFFMKKKHKPINAQMQPEIPNVLFDDIGGLHDVKSKVKQLLCITPSNAPVYFQPPTGMLLYGPPGTGKTMVAKAIATESKANFISISISALIQSEVGESEKTLARLFQRARLSAPCIVFIDEIQALFGDRDVVSHSQSKLISQLILEFDELALTVDPQDYVMVIAATNVPQAIDDALLRPRRIEYSFYVGPPDKDARRHILSQAIQQRVPSAKEYTLFDEPLLDYLVKETHDLTGADLVNIIQQSIYQGLMHGRATPIADDFVASLQFHSQRISSTYYESISTFSSVQTSPPSNASLK